MSRQTEFLVDSVRVQSCLGQATDAGWDMDVLVVPYLELFVRL